ncbi:hypothetical protein CsSME_00026076 [Camellia sinensis var. sinensis]
MHKEFVQCDKKFNYSDVRAQRNLLPTFVKFNDGLTARQWIESELGGGGALDSMHARGVESMLNWSELIECHTSATPHAVGCLPEYCYRYAMIYGNTQCNKEHLLLALTTQPVLATMMRMGMQLPLPRDPIVLVHADAPGPSPSLGLPSGVVSIICVVLCVRICKATKKSQLLYNFVESKDYHNNKKNSDNPQRNFKIEFFFSCFLFLLNFFNSLSNFFFNF